jgi:alpha-amylase/alpha-mannosidase (GH57 family)
MNKKLYLSFLWHMHQPYYMDESNHKISMPWVFLHCLKDYYDMPYYLQKHTKIKATFNLVPSLLEQIQAYSKNEYKDKLLEIMQKEVEFLSEYETEKLFEYLFLSNYENMIKPLKRYDELYLKYQSHQSFEGIFTQEEILDLEILFLLSWCGNYLRQNNAFIKALLLQEKDYTHAQKTELFEELFAFIPTIIPYYQSLEAKGQISISTTPFYHPILPLLLDRQSAKDAKKEVMLPNSQAHYKEFAQLQVEKTLEYYETLFGKKATGFWPSEGSVSLETMNLLAQNKISWACSDEEILYKTVLKSKQESLYFPYRLTLQNQSIDLFFRDKYLSDLIGFEYSSKESNSAARDFLSHLHTIYLNSKQSCLVSVILDGENAWEYYPNNAQDFFKALYSLLEKEPWCETLLFDEVKQCKELEYKEITHLATGSWINANFDIWIGSHEKNRAWELLDMTKNAFDLHKAHLDEICIEKIQKEFMIALGSDWFWWYGDDHYTVLKSKFDKLFRKHLKNIYGLMKAEIPMEILTPIVAKNPLSRFHTKPTQKHQPIIDGRKTNFYEWLYAGYVDLKKDFSTMDTSSLIIEGFFYTCDEEENLYFLFKSTKFKSNLEKSLLCLRLNNKTFEFELQKGFQEFESFSVGIDEYIEVKINHAKQKSVVVSFELFNGNTKIQFAPINKEIVLNFEACDVQPWYV